MKKLILASASPHRKKLLRLLNLPFIVRASAVQEEQTTRASCADLVKKNALKKARDVARNFQDGVVIGADTLVCLKNGKIIGKPRHLKEAKKTLKALSGGPSWVLTGIAVIDVKEKKTLLDVETTKIYMEKMSRKEISQYYREISFRDKSGGFDIQGKGSAFIKRIEGCYYNVVGLPLAKLYRLLKKVGVSVVAVLLMSSFGGCVTEYNLATGQEERLLYGTDKEVKLGDNMSRAFEQQVKLVTDVDVNRRVQDITRKITEVCDRRDLVYTVKVIDDDLVNAVSLPGGYIYIYRGLIDHVKSDDELACVIGHETGHITAKHAVKRIQAMYGYSLLMALSVASGSGNLAQGVNVALTTIFLEYSREDELMADKLGIKYAQKAGFNPRGMAAFLKTLQELQQKESPKQANYWRTHPFIPQRISAVNQEISGRLEFKDYLNLTGEH